MEQQEARDDLDEVLSRLYHQLHEMLESHLASGSEQHCKTFFEIAEHNSGAP